MSFCLKRDAASVVLTIFSGGDTQTLLDGKKLNFMHSQSVGMQKLSNFPWLMGANANASGASASAPYEPPGETFTT